MSLPTDPSPSLSNEQPADLAPSHQPNEDAAVAPESDLYQTFDITLSPAGDAGSSFRTQNDPSAPFQRSNYIERHGAVDVRCTCLDVVHGSFSATSEYAATLLVLLFRFDPRKRARRCLAADITLEFAGLKAGEAGPEVFAISPSGSLTLVPTRQRNETKRSVSFEAGASAPVVGPVASATMEWERSVVRESEDHTSVTGSIDLKGRNWGPSNCASWTLRENKTDKTGVPASMRAAVLLRRKDDMQFKCVVKIDVEVDLTTKIERLFGGKGRVPKDDPVLFDPELEPTNNLRKYDLEELGKVDLDGLCDVTLSTILEGTVKTKELGGGGSGESEDTYNYGYYSSSKFPATPNNTFRGSDETL